MAPHIHDDFVQRHAHEISRELLLRLAGHSNSALRMLCLIVACLAGNAFHQCNAADSIELKEILETWEKRAVSIHSLRLSWKEVQRPGPGVEDHNKLLDEIDTRGLIPPRSTKPRQTSYLFLLEGNKILLAASSKSEHNGELCQTFRTCSFNGEKTTALLEVEGEIPTATVFRTQGDLTLYKLATMRPILSVITPFESANIVRSKTFAFYSVQDLEISGRHSTIGKSQCPMLRFSPAREGTQHLYVDPEQSYSVVRSELHARVDEKLIATMDIQYTDTQGALLPTRWEDTTYFKVNGKVLRSTISNVEDCKLNVPIADSEFEIPFPDDCVIFNHNTGETIRRKGDQEETIHKMPVPAGETAPPIDPSTAL